MGGGALELAISPVLGSYYTTYFLTFGCIAGFSDKQSSFGLGALVWEYESTGLAILCPSQDQSGTRLS